MNLRADAGATSTMRCRDSVVTRGMSGRKAKRVEAATEPPRLRIANVASDKINVFC